MRAPTIPVEQSFDINESSTNNTVVGTVTASDSDVDETPNFNNTIGNTGSGQLRVANSAALDFEMNSNYDLQIKVTDAGDLFSVARCRSTSTM
jgi:hypothetical protein